MEGYLEIIRNAIYFFPIIAFLFTLPYILHQYHKYGSIYYIRVIIVYSFILYLIAAYFLVILPLPTMEEVLQMTSPRTQLIPFSFVQDIMRESSFRIGDITTYLKAMMEPCVYVVVYNIFLTIPFGIYLRYYFNYSKKKTIFYSFLLSLFFELTQLTGLYFIYPRGYRLFDVDDLLLNTLGGCIGVFLADFGKKFLPSRKELDDVSYELGQKVSFFRRVTCFSIDFICFLIFYLCMTLFIRNKYLFWITLFFYYGIIPFLTKGQTLAEKFLNLKLASISANPLKFWQILTYHMSFYFLYLFIPIFSISYIGPLLYKLSLPSNLIVYFYLIGFLAYIFICFLSLIFTLLKRPLFYEKLSNARLISTIQKEEE